MFQQMFTIIEKKKKKFLNVFEIINICSIYFLYFFLKKDFISTKNREKLCIRYEKLHIRQEKSRKKIP